MVGVNKRSGARNNTDIMQNEAKKYNTQDKLLSDCTEPKKPPQLLPPRPGLFKATYAILCPEAALARWRAWDWPRVVLKVGIIRICTCPRGSLWS